MKKFIVALGVMLLVVIVGCSNKNDEQASYQGKLVNTVEKTNNGYRVFLKDVEAIGENKEPQNFETDGVILNIDSKTVEKINDFDKTAKDSQIKFIVKVPTVTTMSIPPQIAGESILEVEIIK